LAHSSVPQTLEEAEEYINDISRALSILSTKKAELEDKLLSIDLDGTDIEAINAELDNINTISTGYSQALERLILLKQAMENCGELELVFDDEYENKREHIVAKDSNGNYYDYDPEKKKFVLRTIEQLINIIAGNTSSIGTYDISDISHFLAKNK